MKFKVSSFTLAFFLFGCSEPAPLNISLESYSQYCFSDSKTYSQKCEGRKVYFDVYLVSGSYGDNTLKVSLDNPKSPNYRLNENHKIDLNVSSWSKSIDEKYGGYFALGSGDKLVVTGIVSGKSGILSDNEIDSVLVIDVVKGKDLPVEDKKLTPEEYIDQNIKEGEKYLAEWDKALVEQAEETRKEYASRAVSHRVDVSIPGIRIDHYKLTNGKYATCRTKTTGPGGPIIDCVESW